MSVAELGRWLLDLFPDVMKDVVKALLVPVVLGAMYFVWAVLRRASRKFLPGDGADCKRRLDRAREAVASKEGIWLTKPMDYPQDLRLRNRASIPIVVLANLKGGVGKTTMTANLAGYLAEQGEKVLLIDLDFQGSLSSMMLADEAKISRPKRGELSSASELLSGQRTAEWLLARARPSPVHANLFTVPAFYDLASTENRMLVNWLIGDCATDMPLFLAKVLYDDAVQKAFDRVLIDAPPRLSAGCIQALAAGTHLLIPTVMDQLSTEAVTTFVNEVEALRAGGVCPEIRYLGIVGSMLPTGNTEYYRPAVKNLNDELKVLKTDVPQLLDESMWIADDPAIGRAAGLTLGVLQGASADRKKIREAFSPLAEEVRRVAPKKVKINS